MFRRFDWDCGESWYFFFFLEAVDFVSLSFMEVFGSGISA